MTLADPIGDMITRIRNGQIRLSGTVQIPASKFRTKILAILKDEGYISNYKLLVNKNNNLSFGIVQGRLSIPPNNQLQWFPQDGWDREFEIASKLGFNYIELIAERQHNPDNPIWNINGIERISELTENSNLFSHAFCNDYVIDHCLIRNSKMVDQTLNLISKGKLLGCEKLIFPVDEI